MRQKVVEMDQTGRVKVQVRGERGARWISGADRSLVQLGRRRRVEVFLTGTQRGPVGRRHAHRISLGRS